MNILVTGSEGFIGNAMVGRLKYEGNLVVGIDQKKNHKHKVSHAPDVSIIGDIRDYKLMMQIIADYEIDEIYHFASKAIVKTCLNDPYGTYDNNISGTVSLLEACRNSGQKVKNIVISTSDKAFGESPVPYTEDTPVRPLYSYDTSKACQQLISISYSKNYGLPVKVVACGNVYGPGDNNFSRIIPKTVRNLDSGELAILYSGSENHIREWVYIDDAVEAFFIVGRQGKSGEVYCCGDTEHVRTGELVRKICELMGKDPLTSVKVIEKDAHFKEISEQYLDATKIRAIGWRYKVSLNEGLRRSIEYYANGFANREEIIIKGETALADKRGKIDNYILTEPINWIGLITTEIVNGSEYMVRANHYHPVQEQKVLVVSGKYISAYRALNDPDGEIKHHIVEAGDLVITPSNVVHAQIFLEDTTLLNLVSGGREKENYGKHTIHYELLKPGDLQGYVDRYSGGVSVENWEVSGSVLLKECRICGNGNLKSVISFGDIPLPNNLLSIEDLDKKDELYHLELMYCNQCHLCQLSHIAPASKMFSDYPFVSSTTFMNREHFRKMAEEIIEDYRLDENSVVVDIGSNDGLFLKNFKNRGIKVCGIDPAKNICKIAEESGIETICDFFNNDTAREVLRRRGKADVVSANNVFAHLHDITGFIENVKEILKNDGLFVMEAQYILDTIKGNTFDNIYHEHHSYYSVLALNEFFKRNGMELIKVKHVEGHGGSIRVFVQKTGGGNIIDESVKRFLEQEVFFGLKDFSTYERFAENIYKKKDAVKEILARLKREGKKIIGYGAPAKATTSLNFYGIDNKYIDYIIEDNPLKRGKLVPGVKIPIRGRDSPDGPLPDYVYVLAWNYAEEIMMNNAFYADKGVKFIIPGERIEVL